MIQSRSSLKRFMKHRRNSMKMWIARDSDNELFLFESEPVLRGCDKTGYLWYEPLDKFERCSKLDEFLFPEVTFENSPMEVELKLIEK